MFSDLQLRWLTLAAAAFASLASAFFGLPSAEKASATPFNVQIRSQQYNAAMVGYGNESRDVIKVLMTVHSPHTVSLVEMCLSDAIWVKNQTGYPMPAMYEAATRTQCDLYNGRRSFGNVAFVTGTSPRGGYERELLAQHDDDLDKPAGPERRGFACTWAQTYVGRLVSCATHLTNQDDGYASTQADQYVLGVALTSGTAGVSLAVLGGDLNLTPTQLPAVYGTSFHRVLTNYTFPSSGVNQTIDYMQVKNPNYTNQVETPPANRSCDNGYSDHCYIWGTFY